MTDDRSRATARGAAAARRPARAPRRTATLLAAGALALAGCSGSADDGSGDAGGAPVASSAPSDPATAPSAPATGAPATGAPAPGASSPAPATTATSEAAGAVADALAASREAGSATFDFSSETSAGGQVVTAAGTGAFDGATGALRVQLTSELPGQGEVAVELRQVDGTAYVSGIPGRPADQWVEVPLQELGAASGPLGGADPSQQLMLLEQVADVERVGSEQVAGVEATHYTGVVDLGAAAERAQQEGVDAQQLQQQYEQLGLSTVPVDVFVGPDGLPVRMASTVETSGSGQQVASTSTVDFRDWGADVQVRAPQGAVPLSEVQGAPTPAG